MDPNKIIKKELKNTIAGLKENATSDPSDFYPKLAQTCHQLAKIYTNENDFIQAYSMYKEAVLTYKTARLFTKKSVQEETDANLEFGILCQKAELFEESENYLVEANKLVDKIPGNSPALLFFSVHIKMHLASNYESLKKPRKTGQTYMKAWPILLKLTEENPTKYIPQLKLASELINNYCLVEDRPKIAQAILLEEVTLLRKLYNIVPKEFQSPFLDILLRAGMWYENAGLAKKAKLYWNEIFNILKEHPSLTIDESELLIQSGSQLGFYALSSGKNKDAENIYRKLLGQLNDCIKNKASNSYLLKRQQEILTVQLAMSLMNQKNFPEADLFYKKALAILENPKEDSGINLNLIASCYEGLGDSHIARNYYEKSIVNYENALKTIQESDDPLLQELYTVQKNVIIFKIIEACAQGHVWEKGSLYCQKAYKCHSNLSPQLKDEIKSEIEEIKELETYINKHI